MGDVDFTEFLGWMALVLAIIIFGAFWLTLDTNWFLLSVIAFLYSDTKFSLSELRRELTKQRRGEKHD